MSISLRSILLLDNLDPICGQLLNQAGIATTTKGKLTKEELLQEVKNHDGIVVRSTTKVGVDVIDSSPRLRVVGRAGTGVDNIDVVNATRAGVIVMNTPDGNTLSAAEHTCALICCLSRHIPAATASLKGGAWEKKQFIGTELWGKTLGIVGLGRIGKEVAIRMQAFKMKTIAFDPIVSAEEASSFGVQLMSLEEIWPQADFLTVHTHLIPQTKGIVGERVFEVCKPTLGVVNVARGGIVNEAELLKALDEGRCGGAALDVFEQEPPTNMELVQHPKVICTPHLGANTKEAQHRVAEQIAEQFINMNKGLPMDGLVNVPTLIHARDRELRPWVQLAQAFGSLIYRLFGQGQEQEKVEICAETFGNQIKGFSNLLGIAVQMGMLMSMDAVGVNLVNASVLAKERGISLITKTSPSSTSPPSPITLKSALSVTYTSGDITHKLLGSIANDQPSLFSLDSCEWKSGLTLGGHMLFLRAQPQATPLASIASCLKSSALTSLLASSPDGDHVWYVARTASHVEEPVDVPDAKLRAQMSFF